MINTFICIMRMRKRKSHLFTASNLVVMTGVLIFLLMAEQVNAGGPWQWKFNLKEDPSSYRTLQAPSALYIDEKRERYYVVDAGHAVLVSYDMAGKVQNSLNPGNELQIPFDMSRDEKGLIWVVDKGTNSLSKIDLKAREVSENHLQYQGKTVFPDRFELEGKKIYILDKLSGAVLVYNMDLELERLVSCSDCGGFIDFKLAGDKIWALSKSNKEIYRFSATGIQEGKINLGDKVVFPVSLAIGPLGNIYVLDRHQGMVVVFDNSGRFKYQFLSIGHNREQLYFPIEIKFDPWGRLCIVDEGNGRVLVFDRK